MVTKSKAQERPCAHCGRPHKRDAHARYCSDRCASLANRQSPTMRLTQHVRKQGALIVEEVDPEVVYQRDKGTCYLCLKPVDPAAQPGPWNATVDHVVPISKGGEHSYANVRLAHNRCNSLKNDSMIGAGAFVEPREDSAATPGPASPPDAPDAAVGPGIGSGAPSDERAVPCEACLSRPAVYDGDLCAPCYNAAVDRELSCDWLPANDDGAEAEA